MKWIKRKFRRPADIKIVLRSISEIFIINVYPQKQFFKTRNIVLPEKTRFDADFFSFFTFTIANPKRFIKKIVNTLHGYDLVVGKLKDDPS